MTTVAIHTHPGSLPFRAYLLWHLVALWRDAGLRVEIVEGARPVPHARVGILHVDLTRVPDEYGALRHAYPALVNGAVLDISKRLLTDLRVSPEDAYDGPVIVKTDLNARGIPERVVARSQRTLPARLWGAALDYARPRRATGRAWHRRGAYPIFPDKAAVPRWVWRRADLVVQRFVAERDRGAYVIRHWWFFGDQTYSVAQRNTRPYSGSATAIGVEIGAPVPPALEAARAAKGFDFGKFDYVVQEGRPWLLDTNKTGGYDHNSVLPPDVFRVLARGIHRWL